jgi:hypothetical protein
MFAQPMVLEVSQTNETLSGTAHASQRARGVPITLCVGGASIGERLESMELFRARWLFQLGVVYHGWKAYGTVGVVLLGAAREPPYAISRGLVSWVLTRIDDIPPPVRAFSRTPHQSTDTYPRTNDAVVDVDDLRAERACLDQLEVRPALVPGEVRDAAPDEHRVHQESVLVDQIQPGRLGGERRAADRDLALSRFGS